jgi:hypothetical protein
MHNNDLIRAVTDTVEAPTNDLLFVVGYDAYRKGH